MVDQGSQMAGNWERRRPEEGGGWETLYDKDGFAYYYSHYTGEQTYNMPKEYALAQGISLPSSVTITESDIYRVCGVLRNILGKYQSDTKYSS